MIIETVNMILIFLAGLAMGALFFGGLWFTVQKAVDAKIPALWIFVSFFLRIGITLLGFYFIGAGNWQRLLVCLAGFIVARFIVIQFTKSIAEKQTHLKKEVSYES